MRQTGANAHRLIHISRTALAAVFSSAKPGLTPTRLIESDPVEQLVHEVLGELFQKLQREGVIVRPMDGYGLPDHVRITVGTREENERCVLALRTVLGK